MTLYITYVVTGLANTYLLLFLAGTTAGPTLIPGIAIIGSLILFATSGLSLFRKYLATWVGIILLSPIVLWQILVLWEQRASLDRLLHPLFSLPLLCTVVAVTISIHSLSLSDFTLDHPVPASLLLRVVLFLVPLGLLVTWIVFLTTHSTFRWSAPASIPG